ncbi:hypothetical protein HPB50_016956 [Hyalomma asiaticum]|uniref:Uncharacterized protein n=1 Tax=Hyalomma asiaticum TaxID=266040 RepID=A0ACB7T5F5_HYAAI|nr:hypothetical protein HPB50_016956 [Hyalomma asiaticum]
MGHSFVDNMRPASLGHVTESRRQASEQIAEADWFVVEPGKDLELLPYALAFPWFNEDGTCYATSKEAARAINRAVESSNRTSRPHHAVGPYRIAQVLCTLALEASYDAHRAVGAAEVDEHLERFERYGSTTMFFIASCHGLCLGSDKLDLSACAECDKPFRNIEGFGEAFGCELGSAMNPVNKTALM